MKTLAVRFVDGSNRGDYHYLVEDNVKVAVGDTAIVHNGTDYRVTTVHDVQLTTSSKATKTVVGIITKADYEDYKQRNIKVNETKAMFQRLDALIKAESEVNKYRYLAETNAEAREILTKLGIV